MANSMRLPYKIVLAFLLLVTTSCLGQKMVQEISDVQKLVFHKEQFIGQPLTTLLEQIEPDIKYVYGRPENRWSGAVGGTYLKFHFVDKEGYGESLRKNRKPVGIVVNFSLEADNTRKPLPKGGLPLWTEEQVKEYGDMRIIGIRITGMN